MRAALLHYKAVTMPELGIDDYAERIYHVNRAAGL